MDTTTSARPRAATADRATAVLAAIDVVVVVGFVTFGLVSHGTSPLSDPVRSLETVAPFLFGWLVASGLAGVYARDVYTSPKRTARLTAVAWIAAANVGLILRTSPVFDQTAVFPFNLVITGFGLLFLLCWRVAYALYASN
ncbi:DUF3054 domain-containing protein [Natrialbaceae archaeon GCM10025810]|uniref:DUF3054 domain-containing protein n=1 Tax=Halovalidus salilacus TaxID=3075124 RepID=UPI0036101CC4